MFKTDYEPLLHVLIMDKLTETHFSANISISKLKASFTTKFPYSVFLKSYFLCQMKSEARS